MSSVVTVGIAVGMEVGVALGGRARVGEPVGVLVGVAVGFGVGIDVGQHAQLKRQQTPRIQLEPEELTLEVTVTTPFSERATLLDDRAIELNPEA
jgi:hypothetical protein